MARPRAQGPPPTIVTKAQIDKIYATATASVPIYPGITANLYNGGPDGVKWGPNRGGPVENHERDEHLYIATYGTGQGIHGRVHHQRALGHAVA